ncbi:MAG: shikimate kinase AroK [Gammaproteobacteria bacterium]
MGMKTSVNIYLVGPMGAGKTTIGRQLAKALGMEFGDSDHEIERRTGADIPWIFDIEGEDGFRQRERAAIEDLTKRSGLVLATGGGVVLDKKNRTSLSNTGIVVYLRASLDKLYERTAKDRNRPLLQDDDPRARLEEMMCARDPLYREVADIIIDTDKKGIRQTVTQLSKQVKQLTNGKKTSSKH